MRFFNIDPPFSPEAPAASRCLRNFSSRNRQDLVSKYFIQLELKWSGTEPDVQATRLARNRWLRSIGNGLPLSPSPPGTTLGRRFLPLPR